ncbi:MAG: hypothetical protein JSR77_09025 [Planctomycetes bacterium]|nr:hypothetical protein [Planctomycetota bacterium]
MFWKLTVLVLSVGLCGSWLLSLRHNRIQALSELTQAQLRINRQDEKLWLLRARIAERITPPQIEQMCADIGPLHPILPYGAAGLTELALAGSDTLVGPPKPGDSKSKAKPGAKPATGKVKSAAKPADANKPKPSDKPKTRPDSPARVATNQPPKPPRP